MRIVLYQPQSVRPSRGPRRLDLLPLALLRVAAPPLRDGHECVLIDGNLAPREATWRRVLEACDGASLFATTGSVGWPGADAWLCARQVRARQPHLPRIVGGPFASAAPELFLDDGVFDAVAFGPSAATLRDVAAALACGEPLDSVPGLVLRRGGVDVATEPRRPDAPLPPAWELLDFEPYRAGQLAGGGGPAPAPPWFPRSRPHVAIDTTSCVETTAGLQRPLPVERVLDELEELLERWGGFDVVRFHDADFGADQQRTRAFAAGLLERRIRIGWNAAIATSSINGFAEATLDACAESGCYLLEVGAAMERQITQRGLRATRSNDDYHAVARLHARTIRASITSFVGFPGESEESMMQTLDEARQLARRCPNAAPTVLRFRPLPGTEELEVARSLGYAPPSDVEGWRDFDEPDSRFAWNGPPPRVARSLALHSHYAALCRSTRRQGGMFGRLAAWRLRNDNLRFPIDSALYALVTRFDGRDGAEKTSHLVDEVAG